MNLNLRGETLSLLPQRAIYWQARHMLIIADIHFGKAASFRAKGIPVPRGTTTQNLGAIDALLAAHDVRHILFLGDFLHARGAHASATLSAMRAWRARHPGLRLTLVRGNHDRHAGDPPADLGLEIVDEPCLVAPFAFSHHPEALDGSYVLAGHVHPVYRLATRHDMLRLPCFVLGPEVCILPSFGAFTGGHEITSAAGMRFFVAVDERIIEVPQPQTRERERT